jgi:hypothetical protein
MSADSSNHDEIVFKPEYPNRVRVSVILFPFGILACVLFLYLTIVSGAIFPNLVFALIFGVTSLSMPMIVFREAHFGEAIVVRRYFLPRMTIRYADVTGLTARGLRAKHGGIPLANVQNRKEFEKIFHQLVRQKKIVLG